MLSSLYMKPREQFTTPDFDRWDDEEEAEENEQDDRKRRKDKPFEQKILTEAKGREQIKNRMDRFVETVRDRKIDTLVFLDKSARPLSWLFRDLWKQKFPEDDRPEIKYVNIGWNEEGIHEGPSELPSRGRDQLIKHHEVFPLIQKSAEQDNWWTEESVPAAVWNKVPSSSQNARILKKLFGDQFKDKSILIVDEVSYSGTSQLFAQKCFLEAFPDAKDIQSMNLFYGGQVDGGLPFVRSRVGRSGVMEMDADSLLASPITEANIDSLLAKKQAEIDKMNEAVSQYFEPIQSLLNTFIHEFAMIKEVAEPGDREGLEQMEFSIAGIQELFEDYEDDHEEAAYFIIGTICDDIDEIIEIYEESSFSEEIRKRLSGSIALLEKQTSAILKAKEALKDSRGPMNMSSYEEMKDESLQMREEMRRLAKEEFPKEQYN